MNRILVLTFLVALLVAGCASAPPADYRIVNNGEVTIISGEKYGFCSAGMKMTKLEVACVKDGYKSLVLLADSFERIEPTPPAP